MEVWRRELKARELAMAAHEAAVFQCELEYQCLEHCALCGKRGRNGDARGRRIGAGDEARQGEDQR